MVRAQPLRSVWVRKCRKTSQLIRRPLPAAPPRANVFRAAGARLAGSDEPDVIPLSEDRCFQTEAALRAGLLCGWSRRRAPFVQHATAPARTFGHHPLSRNLGFTMLLAHYSIGAAPMGTAIDSRWRYQKQHRVCGPFLCLQPVGCHSVAVAMLRGVSGYGHGHADRGTEWRRPGGRVCRTALSQAHAFTRSDEYHGETNNRSVVWGPPIPHRKPWRNRDEISKTSRGARLDRYAFSQPNPHRLRRNDNAPP